LGGGFGLNTETISNVLLTQAIASIFCQMFLIPRFIERLGALRSYRITLFLWIIIYTLMPLSATLTGGVGLLVFMVLLWTHVFCSGTSGTCTSMMITNTAPSPFYLATINGVAASCSCLARTAGPATVGALFRVGLDVGNVGVPFWTLGVITVITLGLTVTLREHGEGNA
jgi:MFS family permease